MREGAEHFDYDCIKFVCKHTINSSDQITDRTHTKFLVLSERGILVTSSIFGAESQYGRTVYALSLVFPHSDLKWYLPLHEFCVSQMDVLVTTLKVLLKKDHHAAAGKFKSLLCKHLIALKSLKFTQCPDKINVKDTVFSSGQEKQIDADLMRRALISHLQTCGCSIVIGDNTEEVNLMLKTLALFISPADRCCSRLAVHGNLYSYHPDIFLQGFVCDSQFSVSSFMKDMMLSRYPATLVDLCSLEVRQMPLCHEHSKKRHDVLRHEMKSLFVDRPNALFLILSAFQQVSTSETLVQNFQKEIFLLPPSRGIRESYIEQFNRLLDRKAFALIKYIESETLCGKNMLKSIKTVKRDMDLLLDGNWKIVLARAERMRNGLYAFVYRDTAQHNEQQVYNALEAF